MNIFAMVRAPVHRSFSLTGKCQGVTMSAGVSEPAQLRRRGVQVLRWREKYKGEWSFQTQSRGNPAGLRQVLPGISGHPLVGTRGLLQKYGPDPFSGLRRSPG